MMAKMKPRHIISGLDTLINIYNQKTHNNERTENDEVPYDSHQLMDLQS